MRALGYINGTARRSLCIGPRALRHTTYLPDQQRLIQCLKNRSSWKLLLVHPYQLHSLLGLQQQRVRLRDPCIRFLIIHPAWEDEVDKSIEGDALLPSDMSRDIRIILGLRLIYAALWLECHGAICIRGSLVFEITETTLHKNFVSRVQYQINYYSQVCWF